jgi:hypothetical protein
MGQIYGCRSTELPWSGAPEHPIRPESADWLGNNAVMLEQTPDCQAQFSPSIDPTPTTETEENWHFVPSLLSDGTEIQALCSDY